LQKQGIGRHAPAEIAAHGIADLDALATLLGDRDFFLGDEPSIVDATAYAFLAWILKPPMTSKTSEHARGIKAFKSYVARMEERFGLLAIPGASS
jgi:glutathione S-transferase